MAQPASQEETRPPDPKGPRKDTKEGGQEEAGGAPDAAEKGPRESTPRRNHQLHYPTIAHRDTEQEHTGVGEIRGPRRQQKKAGVTRITGTKGAGAQRKVDTTPDPGEERDEAPREQAKQGQGRKVGERRNLDTTKPERGRLTR